MDRVGDEWRGKGKRGVQRIEQSAGEGERKGDGNGKWKGARFLCVMFHNVKSYLSQIPVRHSQQNRATNTKRAKPEPTKDQIIPCCMFTFLSQDVYQDV